MMNRSDLELGESVGGRLEGAGDAPPAPDVNATPESPRNSKANENESCPFIQALQQEKVADKLVSLINFEDMKSLSSVSTTCLTSIRKTKEFSERARLIICKQLILLGVLEETTYQWKHLYIDLSLPVEVFGLIEDILPSVTTLSLHLPNVKDNAELVNYLIEIFTASPNLKSLQLDALIMKYMLHDVFSDIGVQKFLTNLECLDFQSSCCSRPTTRSICYIDDKEDEDTMFQRNFLQLSMIPLRLKKFSFGKVLPIYGSESWHAELIPKIVACANDTLVDLELHLDVWKFDEMMAIRCPKLKRLVLSANGNERDAHVAKRFIKNQPPLEELTIHMYREFPFSLLQVIQGVKAKLKKLHMKGKTFFERAAPVDWSFLQTMLKLRDFYLRKPYSTGDSEFRACSYGEEILWKLPCATEKISLIGFNPFWKDECPQCPMTNNIGNLLSRFNNLKEINLIRSAGAITDDGMQTIISECRKLVSLAFSHCHELTDFGITGIRQNEDTTAEECVGGSLKDLTGLTCLKIRSCPSITADCLLNVVQFSFLRTFDYYRNVRLPKEFLFQIAKQNPCLEEVSLHITSYENDVEYLKELKRKVKAINPRLHLIGNLEQSNWEDEDSDSDASSIHEFNESDFSCDDNSCTLECDHYDDDESC